MAFTLSSIQNAQFKQNFFKTFSHLHISFFSIISLFCWAMKKMAAIILLKYHVDFIFMICHIFICINYTSKKIVQIWRWQHLRKASKKVSCCSYISLCIFFSCKSRTTKSIFFDKQVRKQSSFIRSWNLKNINALIW